jgi:NAD(P)-dependent dehydrogenase (short-subunit alcohol dehydrogenase family)
MTTRVAVVTGASSGIGRASALVLAEQGFAVVLAARRQELLADLRDEIESAGGQALATACDVRDEESVLDLFATTRNAYGRIDVLFNNAGAISTGTPIDEVTLDNWNTVIGTNLTGAFLCAREAFRAMKEQDPQGGRIINNGSVSAHVPRANSVAYTASKHAITGLTRSLSLDGRPYRIACGQIDIGNAVTRSSGTMPGFLTAGGEPTMDVAEVARAVGHMASLPLDANIQFMTIMATAMPYIGRG